MSSKVLLKQKLDGYFARYTLQDIQSAYGAGQKRYGKGGKLDEAVQTALESLGFWKGLNERLKNPLLAKCFDWGGIVRILKKRDTYERLRNVVEGALRGGLTPRVAQDIQNYSNQLRDEIIAFIIERMGDVEKGLRHLHAPGSVARTEARNLYYGEDYSQDLLYEMALRLVDSFVIEGGNMGIYVSDEQFRRDLATYCASRLNFLPNQLKAQDLGIQPYERQRPHVVFLKFLLWIRRHMVREEDATWKKTLEDLVARLKEAAFLIYFMPGNEREKWATIAIPRVDLFVARWIETEDRRAKLENFMESFNKIIGRIREEARRRREVKRVDDAIELLMHNYDLLCRQLLLHGVPDSYSVKNIVDILMELALRYDVPASLGWSSWLTQSNRS